MTDRGPASFDVKRALSSPDPEERRRAAMQLGAVPLEEAVPMVISALGDEDWRVRKEATVAARAFLPAEVLILALVEALRSSDVGLCNAAVEVLGAAGAAATPQLSAALAALGPDGRKLAAEALGRTRDSRALTPLRRALTDVDPNVRQTAAESIAMLSGVAPEVVEGVLIELLADADPIVRLSALSGLDALGTSVPWDRLEPLLEDPTLRPLALTAVARAGHAGAPVVLARALGASSGRTFDAALSAFALVPLDPLPDSAMEALRASSPAVLDRLLRAARNGDMDHPERRHTALLVGAALGDHRMIDVAIGVLGEPGLSSAAQNALERLGSAALEALIARLGRDAVEEGDEDARTVCVDVVARMAERDAASRAPALAALRRAAHGYEMRTASRALYALGALGEADDLALVEAVFLRSDGAVAYAAEAALIALASRHAAAAHELALVAEAATERARAAAVTLGALAEAGALGEAEARALRFLAQAATSEDAATRRTAAAALARVGGTVAVDALAIALADEEREVRRTAARGLGRLAAMGDDARLLTLVRASGDPELLAASVRAAGDVLSAADPGSPLSLALSLAPPSLGLGFASPGPFGTPAREPRPTFPRAGTRASDAPPSSRPPASADHLIAALAGLCVDSSADVATAALDALRRAPAGVPGRLEAMARALDHPDVIVVKTAILKLAAACADEADAAGPPSAVERASSVSTSPQSAPNAGALRPPPPLTSQSAPPSSDAFRVPVRLPPGAWDRLRRCLDHDLAELRSIAAECICAIDPARGRAALVERARVERDPEVLATIDAALSVAQRQKKGAGLP